MLLTNKQPNFFIIKGVNLEKEGDGRVYNTFTDNPLLISG